jgi:hypothetical protein
MILRQNNDPTDVFDTHFALKCPHCQVQSNISAIAIPRYEYMQRFRPQSVGIAYRCDSCNSPVFLRFLVEDYASDWVRISHTFEEVEHPQETFEFEHLPQGVAADFREALTCYSHACFNAFAAMCRRCIQSSSTALGAEGKDKVMAQLNELKSTAEIGDDTYAILEQIVISGHDGVHPYLPALSKERAAVLLELMKDVLYQLFVRKAKIQQSIELRRKQISETKESGAV